MEQSSVEPVDLKFWVEVAVVDGAPGLGFLNLKKKVICPIADVEEEGFTLSNLSDSVYFKRGDIVDVYQRRHDGTTIGQFLVMSIKGRNVRGLGCPEAVEG